MVAHATLTDPELHEPKGIASASANTVYRANGSGGGSWVLLNSNSLNSSSILNINKILLNAQMDDIGTVGTIYIPIPYACNVTAIYGTVQAAVAGADTVLTIANNGGTSMGTLTFNTAGSAPGSTSNTTSLTNNSFTAGQTLRITTDGAATSVVAAIFSIELTLT